MECLGCVCLQTEWREGVADNIPLHPEVSRWRRVLHVTHACVYATLSAPLVFARHALHWPALARPLRHVTARSSNALRSRLPFPFLEHDTRTRRARVWAQRCVARVRARQPAVCNASTLPLSREARYNLTASHPASRATLFLNTSHHLSRRHNRFQTQTYSSLASLLMRCFSCKQACVAKA
jgi:hypothetical protein